jgi:hypothetical protein
MIAQGHPSTKLLVKNVIRLCTIFLKETGDGVRVTGSDGVVKLLKPFTRDVFGGDSCLRRFPRRLVDRGVGQFGAPEVLLEDGDHCY